MPQNDLMQEQELPDLSEFDGMSIVDIAHNIINWPEGSEDQWRAIMAIRARAPGIGHNRPPLVDQLAIDTAGLAGEVEALVTTTESSRIIDDESAAKVNDLLRQVTDKINGIEAARKARNLPYANAVNAINDCYHGLRDRLVAAARGVDNKGGLIDMLTQWDNKKRAEVAAAQQKARDEQAARDAAAAEARRKAEEAANAGNLVGSVSAELQSRALQEEADRAGMRAEAIRPAPIRSTLGSTSRSRVIHWKIENEDQAFAWARSTSGLKENLAGDLYARIGSYLKSRAVGVAAVQRGVSLPGIKAWIELSAIQSRR